ncbi:hypothetical protein [Calderihabitans maritimus]|uniref:Uncharacterized protein n=1 Tax=Calderihabitans maritimus TaxID=1246530 RepID=A0A1Z5HWE6_9FIRM|nr:hypothetical protein [Calderihabitans maritimus]GAW93677.1 hypothetical protein KKC1_28050 [Calderihabitans maritimus]
MGIRLNQIQQYVEANKPVLVQGCFGNDMESAWRITVQNTKQDGMKHILLSSFDSSLILQEEEIANIVPGDQYNSLMVRLDNGQEIYISPQNPIGR